MMAARTMSLGNHEICVKETLQAQQELLQDLYTELDQERESSATAADETLSMILRLQGEKAAMEMEASQYKRIAEEKMHHAHETLETFQEVIYHKEMQIASLEFQVQAYKFKLASLGINDLASSDVQYPENILSRKNNGLVEETNSQTSVEAFKRGYSLPPRADSNSYSEEIKKLDERVKEFTKLDSLNNVPVPEGSLNWPDDSSNKTDIDESSEKVLDVQGIFEVTKCSDDDKKGKPELNLEKEIGIKKMDCEKTSMKLKDVIEKIARERKPLVSLSEYNGSHKPKSGWPEIQKLLKNQTFGVADFEVKQFNRRLKQIEDGRFMSTVRESNHENEDDEELKLLREIMEKVEAMQSEITSWRTKKFPPQEDRSFGCFKEVMQCFLP
ncbi:uncharacterized protein LOC141597175 [Silene latifolia]|uniref:uncharacterized protein LOC141597175 n=1 Tax=Silene latifolia TaxID=37657 RepID=UPI003D777F9D